MPRDFQQEIESDLDWREGEIAYIRVLIGGERSASTRQRVLLRSGWALLYAHYEGFCRFCFRIYLEAISEIAPNTAALSDRILALALSDDISRIKNALPALDVVRYVNTELRSRLRAKPTFDDSLSDANLWPWVFEKICDKMGIQTTEIKQHERKIATLVARRNDIAHGQNVTISDFSYYQEYENSALLVMYDLALRVGDAINAQAFRR
jgi:hypothetical protein